MQQQVNPHLLYVVIAKCQRCTKPKNCLSLYFLQTSGVWIGAAVPRVLTPQPPGRLRDGSGTEHAGGWLLVKFCALTGAGNKLIVNMN